MTVKMLRLLILPCFFIAESLIAQDQHQHRRPDDIKKYLEQLLPR